MLRYRIIPTLLLHNKGLYKTVKYSVKKGKYVGDPINAIKVFNDKGVDELIFLDIDASKKGLNPNFDIIQKIASECFMPIAFGGGVRTAEQARKILAIGVEKVVLNTELLQNPKILSELARQFGSQSIVASIDVKKNFLGKYTVYNSSTGKSTKINLETHLKNLEELGAGEFYISSVDQDGTFSGYDIELIKKCTSLLNTPVIINGGAANIGDLSSAIKEGGASAISAGSMFVFNGPHKAVLITYPKYEDLISRLNT